ncbi:MAG: TetR/AcrR family transcriptional regulator C-terminal domain-containing protein [Mogibacterium sp.]|nr:TetR/AcrR family transcriptional regulator C-terminal domain-containing protein [Mogibacterium sp.]
MSAKTTRTLLIRAMLKLVRAQKFSAITIDDICEKAEVSRRTFYRYYSDKHALLRDVFVECFFSNINTEECKDPWDIIEAVCKQIYSDKKFFSHSFEVRGQNGFWEEVRAILLPYFQRNFPSYGDADRMRDFFASTDIYRALTLLEEWIRNGMQITPEEFASTLRTSYIVYATWITEVATGKPATEFPAEMLEPVANIKK